MEKYTHRDWKKLKIKYRLKPKVLAEITGLKPRSITVMTSPKKKDLPTWVKTMLFIEEQFLNNLNNKENE
jgi:predicted glycosyl hydrolase (DUF1957 family)